MGEAARQGMSPWVPLASAFPGPSLPRSCLWPPAVSGQLAWNGCWGQLEDAWAVTWQLKQNDAPTPMRGTDHCVQDLSTKGKLNKCRFLSLPLILSGSSSAKNQPLCPVTSAVLGRYFSTPDINIPLSQSSGQELAPLPKHQMERQLN